jgi:hypothetical protein
MNKLFYYLNGVFFIVLGLPSLLYAMFYGIYYIIKNRHDEKLFIDFPSRQKEMHDFFIRNSEMFKHYNWIFWILLITYFTFR